MAASAAAEDLFRFGAQSVRLGWAPPGNSSVLGYAVYLSRDQAPATFHKIVTEPEITLVGEPAATLQASVRALVQGTSGELRVSPESPASPLVHFVPETTWHGSGHLVLHCGACGALQTRDVANTTEPSEAPSLGNDWKLVATGPIDARSGDDGLWQNVQSGIVVVHPLDRPPGEISASGFGLEPGQVLGLAEIDGDGTREIVVRRFESLLEFWQVTQGTLQPVAQITAPLGWTFVEALDANGDGIDDIWWQGGSPGTVHAWKMGPQGVRDILVNATTPASGALVEVADFDADGHPDALWRDANGQLTITYLARGDEDDTASLKSTYRLPHAEHHRNLRVRAAVEVDGSPGADILVQDVTDFRVSVVLAGSPTHVPVFDMDRPFELIEARP